MLALYLACSANSGRKTSGVCSLRSPRSRLRGGDEDSTHHVAAGTVGSILTSPAASLDATPALGCAPLPRTPARPEHVRGAQQVLIAVSVKEKPRGKGNCLRVQRKAPGLPGSVPAPDVGHMGMLSVEGLLCLK